MLLLSACVTNYKANKPTAKYSGITKTIEIKKVEIQSASRQDRINNLLLFIDHFSNDTLEAQKKSFNETIHALSENKSDLTERIKLAIMLSLPSSRMRDTAKAQNLIQDLLQESTMNPEESALTGLFYEYVLDDNKQSQKNKDDLKKLDLSQQKVDALQQKYDALDKKLNDLKSIEKTISDRDSKVINKQPIKP
jgi:prefoldin subunit 5